MTRTTLEALLKQVAAGSLAPAEAVERLRDLPFENLDFARIDHHRALRCGMPEVIFGAGKTPAQLAEIFSRLAASGANVLATRVTESAAESVQARLPAATHDPLARTLTLRQRPPEEPRGRVIVAAAGTSDLPVALEARHTVELMDQQCELICDVGVAGLQRLLVELPRLRTADALILIAGMEGALPSVAGGLLDVPIVAVPTSVGYGASLGGLAALLAMLNSCAAGIAVVNIDNGYGAGVHAARIARQSSIGRESANKTPANRSET